MRFIWVFLVVASSACSGLPGSTGPNTIDPGSSFIGPNGGPAYLMPCFWSSRECYKRAREVCPSGYTIFDSIDDSNHGSSGHYIAYECKK